MPHRQELLALINELRAWPTERAVRQLADEAAALKEQFPTDQIFAELCSAALALLIFGRDPILTWRRFDTVAARLKTTMIPQRQETRALLD